MTTADPEDGDICTPGVDETNWTEGVDALRHLTVKEVSKLLGLADEQLPFFNAKVDNTGNYEPWSEKGRAALQSADAQPLRPFWHQWIGILKMVDNMMADRNVFLFDSVSVGKTLQAVGVIAMYEFLRHCSKQPEGLPSRFSTSFPSPVSVLSLTHPSRGD